MILSNGVATGVEYDALGDRTPLMAASAYYPAGSMLELSGLWAAYGALYKSQVWVNTVIRKLAAAHSKLPFVVSSPGTVGRAPAPESDYAKLMATPNPRMDPFTLWRWTSSTWDVFGEAYWLKVRDANGQVREIYPIHPLNLVVDRDQNDVITYIYTSGSRRIPNMAPIAEADIVPFLSFNPETIWRGLSNLEPLRQTLLNEDASRRATASWWQKGARPSVMLNHPRHLSDGAQTRLRSQIQATNGGVDNTGGTMILEEGMTATTVQLSAEEMQYIESRKLNREEVCAAYDVSPPVVHLLENANFGSLSELNRGMYRDTMTPRTGYFESVLEHHLRPEFDKTGQLAGAFDMDSVLRGDFETRAAAISPLITNGVFKPSEARVLFNLPDAGPVADRLYANAALLPLGTVPTAAPALALQTPQVSPAVLSHRRAVRHLMGIVGTKSPTNARDELVAQHAAALRQTFARQHAAAMDTGSFDDTEWDPELVDTLGPLTEATAKTLGGTVAKTLGSVLEYAPMATYLATGVVTAARAINAKTGEAITAALASADAHAALSDLSDQAGARADDLAGDRVDAVGWFAGNEAGKQSGAATKTWSVTSGKPRSSHAAMNGETVGVDDNFSNGLAYPHDMSADAAETCGCTCTVDYHMGGT